MGEHFPSQNCTKPKCPEKLQTAIPIETLVRSTTLHQDAPQRMRACGVADWVTARGASLVAPLEPDYSCNISNTVSHEEGEISGGW